MRVLSLLFLSAAVLLVGCVDPARAAAFAVHVRCRDATCDDGCNDAAVFESGSCIAAPVEGDADTVTTAPLPQPAAKPPTPQVPRRQATAAPTPAPTAARFASRRFVGCSADFMPMFEEYDDSETCTGVPARRVTIGHQCRNRTHTDNGQRDVGTELWRCDERPLSVYIIVVIVVVVVLALLITGCCCCCCCGKPCRRDDAAKPKETVVVQAAPLEQPAAAPAEAEPLPFDTPAPHGAAYPPLPPPTVNAMPVAMFAPAGDVDGVPVITGVPTHGGRHAYNPANNYPYADGSLRGAPMVPLGGHRSTEMIEVSGAADADGHPYPPPAPAYFADAPVPYPAKGATPPPPPTTAWDRAGAKGAAPLPPPPAAPEREPMANLPGAAYSAPSTPGVKKP